MDILLFIILIDILENLSVEELEYYKNHDMKVLSEGMDLKTVYESDKCIRELIDMFIEQKKGER